MHLWGCTRILGVSLFNSLVFIPDCFSLCLYNATTLHQISAVSVNDGFVTAAAMLFQDFAFPLVSVEELGLVREVLHGRKAVGLGFFFPALSSYFQSSLQFNLQ